MASVLIVDDEQDLAALVEFNLHQAGFETHIAMTGAQALELAQQRVPDVVLLTAEGLVKRLVALVPPARLHLTSGHGVYAANAALRSVVLRQEPVPAQQPQEAPAAATRAPPSPSPAEQEKPARCI